jgi:hypothetical protein
LFSLIASIGVDTGSKFAARCAYTGGKFTTSINDTSRTGGKSSAGAIDTCFVDTCGNFATGVIDIGGAP